MKKVEIDLQYFDGCPNAQIMKINVANALKGIESNINYRESIIDTNEKAMLIRFRGSPTLIVNGFDIENMLPPINGQLSCRYYPHGLPSSKEIRIFIESFF